MQPNYAQPSPGYPYVSQAAPKDWFITLILALFFGFFGVHRFYTGKVGTGILMLVTAGGCGIWWLIDLVMIAVGAFRDKQNQPLMRKA
jgi:TM2 domain-containing membrane protein YozV